jgi:hypothetical protein
LKERAKVNLILKIKVPATDEVCVWKEGASVSFVGTDDHIEEFVFFANKEENGFAVVRILGKDMNPD